MFFSRRKSRMPTEADALPGREAAMPVPERHAVRGAPLAPPFPDGLEQAVFGMGCFWGAEKTFWQTEGVYTTAVGYAGGFTANPTYEEVCSGMTGHAEVVLVVFDPARISYEQLLKIFWENHDPTQGMRQATTPAPSTARPSTPSPRRSRSRPRPPGTPTSTSWTRPATRRSPPRSARPRPSTTPRATTSSTCTRTRCLVNTQPGCARFLGLTCANRLKALAGVHSCQGFQTAGQGSSGL